MSKDVHLSEGILQDGDGNPIVPIAASAPTGYYSAYWADGQHDTGREVDPPLWVGTNGQGDIGDAFAISVDTESIEALRSGLYVVRANWSFDSVDLAAPSGVRPGIVSISASYFCNGAASLNIQAAAGAGEGHVEDSLASPYTAFGTDVVWIEAGDSIAGYAYGEINTATYDTPKISMAGGVTITAVF